ncbi:MAG: hypothetical protein FE834_05200 [Gammaproteobacteria bacterium]|nr:hypothetical protein [Gammaproteobacteria bacterium]
MFNHANTAECAINSCHGNNISTEHRHLTDNERMALGAVGTIPVSGLTIFKAGKFAIQNPAARGFCTMLYLCNATPLTPAHNAIISGLEGAAVRNTTRQAVKNSSKVNHKIKSGTTHGR